MLPSPPHPLLEQRFKLADLTATERLGQGFAQAFSSLHYSGHCAGFRVHLRGELGSGKTALARAVLLALGVTGRIRSPTYTLVEHYALHLLNPISKTLDSLDIYHFDLYRFTHAREWIDAGFQEYLATRTLCLIEWPERAGSLLDTPDLDFIFEMDHDQRHLTARAFSRNGQITLTQCL